ncbi:MAG: zinc ABC transporter substrate-binding protein [Ruminococcus sp.]|nr:zinc ABC transporter substrate-binding protein [Ruminococcus sp.]
MLKKFLSALLVPTLLLAGCGISSNKNDDKLDIVCTVFPAYDWTRHVAGDDPDVRISYLLESGSDLHNFQPTADDIIRISDCDIFIYVGGESDAWVEDALSNARNKNMTVINLLDVLSDSLKEEEIKEGMEGHEDCSHDDETEYDEHIWLSLNNAERCVSEISRQLGGANKDNAQKYEENAAEYNAQLQLLDRSFHMLFDEKNDVMIFGDRFPFRYFTEDYGIDYYAAFPGCSADTDASFETIAFLAGKADEVGADTIFAIENSDCTIADAVVENTAGKSAKIAVLDSIQSVSGKQIEDGATYLSIMDNNYQILKEAFQ